MPDPLFESLRQPAPVTPPELGVIRRRGEQRKKRTAIAAVVGAVAVVAAVVVPVAALTGGGDRSHPPVLPSPSPTRTADVAWVLTIPDGFPLGDGVPMPGEASAGIEHGKGLPLQPCADGQSSVGQSGWTDVATSTNRDVVDPADGTDTRVLALYSDGASARQALTAVRQMYAACPHGQGGGAPFAVEPIGDGDAWLLTVEEARSSALAAGTLVTVERVGNALLMQQDTLRPANVRSHDQQLADVRAGQVHVVAAMCVFAADPCASPAPTSAPSSTPGTGDTEAAHVDEIPADFPIDAAHEDLGGDGQVHGPGPTGQSVSFDPCGAEVFGARSQDQLLFQVTGPEYADTRELRTYPSADDAVRQMEELRDAVSACPRQPAVDEYTPAVNWTSHDVATGYDSFAAAFSYDDGSPGAEIWVFTRVGRSIIALETYGEYSRDNLWDALPPLLDRTDRITPAMCLFTVAGC